MTDTSAAATLAGLKDPDEAKRRRAAEELGQWARSAMMSMSDPGAKFPIVAAAALAGATKDPSPRVREAVAAALGGFPPTAEGIEALTGLLKDEDRAVRTVAAVALCRLAEGDAAAEVLADAWDGKAGAFPGAGAEEALKLVGTSRGSYRAFSQNDRSAPVVHCLIDGLKDQDRSVRLASALALAQLGRFEVPADRVAPALVKVLRSRDPAKRRKAAETLRGLGVEAADAIEPLKEAAKDPDLEVRRLAAELLRQIAAASAAQGP
jgi:HEAT repeat protein